MATDSKTRGSQPSQPIHGQDSVIIEDGDIRRRTSMIAALQKSATADIADIEAVRDSDPEEKRLFMAALKRDWESPRYTIKKKVKSGGMGEIYFAFDRDFERTTAMKVILPELRTKTDVINNFIREARITSQLEHPNIIPVHDLGYLPGHGIFFTMKLMTGESLNSVLQKMEIGDKLILAKYDLFELLNIFKKVCHAVAFAHSKNIIHRDIKPHNIMIGDYGEVLLMDWGLAKRLRQAIHEDEVAATGGDSQLSQATEAGIIKGSPAYMSPEQAFGNIKLMDRQSDIFLLGATLYQIFTFYPPYLGDDIYEIVQNARQHNLIAPEDTDSGVIPVPEDLRRIMMRALASDKVDRYESVEDLIDDIDAYLRGDLNFCHHVFQEGEVMISEGDVGSESYIIVRGEVEVYKSIDGKKVPISRLTTGDIVGEMSLITQETRSATVRALTETEVLVLSEELFHQHLTRLPPWLGKTIYLLAERLNKANTRPLIVD